MKKAFWWCLLWKPRDSRGHLKPSRCDSPRFCSTISTCTARFWTVAWCFRRFSVSTEADRHISSARDCCTFRRHICAILSTESNCSIGCTFAQQLARIFQICNLCSCWWTGNSCICSIWVCVDSPKETRPNNRRTFRSDTLIFIHFKNIIINRLICRTCYSPLCRKTVPKLVCSFRKCPIPQCYRSKSRWTWKWSKTQINSIWTWSIKTKKKLTIELLDMCDSSSSAWLGTIWHFEAPTESRDQLG